MPDYFEATPQTEISDKLYIIGINGGVPDGKLVGEVSTSFKEFLNKYADNDIFIDMSKMTWTDISALCAIIGADMNATRSGHYVGLYSPNKEVLGHLERMRINKVIPVHKSYDDILSDYLVTTGYKG